MLFSVKARKPRPHSLGAISGAWNAFSVSNFCLKFLSLILVSMFYCYSASILDHILVDSIFFKSTYLILLLLIGGAPLKKQPALSLPPLLLPSLPPLIGNRWLLGEKVFGWPGSVPPFQWYLSLQRVCLLICEVSGGMGGLHVCDLNSV